MKKTVEELWAELTFIENRVLEAEPKLKLSPSQKKIFDLLASDVSRWWSLDEFEKTLYQYGHTRRRKDHQNCIRQFILRLRNKLSEHGLAIEGSMGRSTAGYRLVLSEYKKYEPKKKKLIRNRYDTDRYS